MTRAFRTPLVIKDATSARIGRIVSFVLSAWHSIVIGGRHEVLDLEQRTAQRLLLRVQRLLQLREWRVFTHVTGNVAGGHCISIVGYDDAAGCWMAKNSWGTGWGESGFFQIAYGQGAYPDGSGAIDSQMWAVDGIVATGWENNQQVEGLWTIDQDRNAWAYFDGGVGGGRSPPTTTTFSSTRSCSCTSAKEAGRPVSFYEDQGVIKQLYVV